MSNEPEYLENAKGYLVPIDKIKAEDRMEDELVRELFRTAKALQSDLREFKRGAFSNVDAFLELLSEKYGVTKGGKKGNVTLTSYNGLIRLQISNQDYIQFGPQLQIAKELIDECINAWSQGANANLKIIVDQAFSVDKNNRLNTKAILGLRRYNITDEKWEKAMQAITDSIRTESSKRYIRFSERDSIDDDFETKHLDMAKV